MKCLRPRKSTKLATTSEERNPADTPVQRIFAMTRILLEWVSEWWDDNASPLAEQGQFAHGTGGTPELCTKTIGIQSLRKRLLLRPAFSSEETKACEDFHTDKGKYPNKLEDLVPGYLSSVPRAKYCLMQGEFMYWDSRPSLCGVRFRRSTGGFNYFEDRQWGYID